jgi:hypothetical protein
MARYAESDLLGEYCADSGAGASGVVQEELTGPVGVARMPQIQRVADVPAELEPPGVSQSESSALASGNAAQWGSSTLDHTRLVSFHRHVDLILQSGGEPKGQTSLITPLGFLPQCAIGLGLGEVTFTGNRRYLFAVPGAAIVLFRRRGGRVVYCSRVECGHS